MGDCFAERLWLHWLRLRREKEPSRGLPPGHLLSPVDAVSVFACVFTPDLRRACLRVRRVSNNPRIGRTSAVACSPCGRRGGGCCFRDYLYVHLTRMPPLARTHVD